MQLKGVRVRERRVTFAPTPLLDPAAMTILVPFGRRADPATHSLSLSNAGGRPVIRSRNLTAPPGSGASILYPPYEAQVTTRMGPFRAVKLRLWLVTTDLDRLKAQKIISRSHYLVAPQRGYILACSFVNPAQQGALRDAAAHEGRRARLDPWSSAWTETPGGMVACATLDTMTHGNPTLRECFAVGELGRAWNRIPRDKLMRDLEIAWASRFAVDAPYRSLGLGTILAVHLKPLAAHYRDVPARYIEVITTHPRKRAEALLSNAAGTGDFLVQAGYIRAGALKRSKPLMLLNHTTGLLERHVATKLYYYAKL